ncbi:hypothetical protein P879_10003 [Paragonimus westermani]|uniref:Major facilitator superfamily (MFS) profile domain-containing protein n=1 Tax=Paragonimus westermani TaxID=34504 RepID=A0A8T0DA62_9TREM|nr:hypothetical protein P879_10003 [Paragonimus westermani]
MSVDPGSIMKRIPLRVVIMFVLCVGTINLYSQRMCLSVAVICMTNHSASQALHTLNISHSPSVSKANLRCDNDTGISTKALSDGPFLWDSQTRGHILGVFFWGYLIGQIPSGIIAQKFGARRVVLVSLVILGCATALIPLAVFYSIYMLYAFRIVAGLASAAWFPSFYQIWALWAPPNERGILIGLSYAGVHIGNAITLPIAGALCQTSIGWPLVFYFYGR